MKRLKRFLKKTAAPQKGFTLLEMVIVLAIIALLMLIVIPNLNAQRETAAKRSDAALEQVVNNQAEMYANDKGQAIENVTLEDLHNNQYLNDDQFNRAQRMNKEPNHATSVKK